MLFTGRKERPLDLCSLVEHNLQCTVRWWKRREGRMGILRVSVENERLGSLGNCPGLLYLATGALLWQLDGDGRK